MGERDEAYTEFVRSTAGTLRRTAYLVCGDWHRADDAVQDALYKLYLAWPRVHRAGNIQAYARRAVVNSAIDTGRRPWRRETTAAVLPDREVPDRTTDHADRDELLDALAVLGPRQRACVVLRFYDGLSIEETAEVLDCAAGTVKSQTSRGLDHLRDHLTRTRSANRVT
ncbi:MAG: SigE family RNA polymerase sigma factor [Kribbellaceae bacterium]|jgi:RNA polymerase sigma-70 factor (sigma-E family)